MKAVVMAGGLGERLRPLTEVMPKPLLPLGESSILEIILKRLALGGVSDVFLTVNYMSESFQTYFEEHPVDYVKLHFSKETTKLGTAGPLDLIRHYLDKEPFIVVNGDILTTLDFAKFSRFFHQNEFDILVGTKEVILPTQYGIVSAFGNRITKIEEKPGIPTEIVAGIYMISPNIFQRLEPAKRVDMPDLIRPLIESGKVGRYPIEDYWLDIGHMENYKKACVDVKKLAWATKQISRIKAGFKEK